MTKDKIVYRYKELKELRYEIMRNSLRRLTNRNYVEKFKDSTFDALILDEYDERRMIKSFDLFNSISFGGFDYYHYSPIGEMVSENESLIGTKNTINVLINKDHLGKLKQVVDCFPQFEFISYMEDDEHRYSIWDKTNNTRIDLIPFKRLKDKIEIVSDDDCEEEFFVRYDSHNDCPYKSLSFVGNEDSKVEHIKTKQLVR